MLTFPSTVLLHIAPVVYNKVGWYVTKWFILIDSGSRALAAKDKFDCIFVVDVT